MSAFSKLDDDLISSVRSSSHVNMIAQTLPQVTAARINYYVIVGKPVTFNLTNHNPNQEVDVRWILGNQVLQTGGYYFFLD